MISTFVLVAVPVVIGLGLVRKYRVYTWGHFKLNKSLSGKVFLVTGSNSGIGKETARELAKRNACVIMACRDMDSAKVAIMDIRKTTTAGELVPIHLDLASFQSIRKFSQEILNKYSKIDVLINNAGVSFPLTNSQRTKEGFEMNFGVNHLGHFLLTELLKERLIESAPSRIVIVSSTLHEKGQLNLDDLNMDKRRETFKSKRMNPAYCASKLANMYHCRELAKRLKGSGVDVYAVCPGFTYTKLFRYSNIKFWQYILFLPVAFWFMRTSTQGAQTVLYCACNESLTGKSGLFYRDCKEYSSKKEFDSTLQIQLWEKSEEIVKQLS